jgi:hypothetical protein
MKSIFTCPTPHYEDFTKSVEAHPWRHQNNERSIALGTRQAGPTRHAPGYFAGETMGKKSPEGLRKAHLTRNQRHLL